MRSFSPAIMLSVGVQCLLGSSSASLVAEIPGERIVQAAEFVGSAKVALASAIWAASHEHPRATPFRAEISPIRPAQAYSVFLLTESGVVRCDVDAFCGDVLDLEDAPVEEIDELRRIVRQSKVSLLDATAFAERHARGKPFRAEFQSAAGKTRAVVEMISQGRVIELPLHRIPKLESQEFVQTP